MDNLKESVEKKKVDITRRTFIGSAAAATAFTIVPSSVLAKKLKKTPTQAPSDKLNVAAIGAGGMGSANINNLAGEKIDPAKRENIVALCDVDDERGAPTYKQFRKCKNLPRFPCYAGQTERH